MNRKLVATVQALRILVARVAIGEKASRSGRRIIRRPDAPRRNQHPARGFEHIYVFGCYWYRNYCPFIVGSLWFAALRREVVERSNGLALVLCWLLLRSARSLVRRVIRLLGCIAGNGRNALRGLTAFGDLWLTLDKRGFLRRVEKSARAIGIYFALTGHRRGIRQLLFGFASGMRFLPAPRNEKAEAPTSRRDAYGI
ncbi:hypothetical protein AB7M37_001436 [Sinorhizobium fredii]